MTHHGMGSREIWKKLDPTNISILTAMATVGPRNLLEVSRQLHVPITTVYHRVARLESTFKEGLVHLIPSYSRLGLLRTMVLAHANPGAGEQVTRALKIPDMWTVVEPLEGSYTHRSIQLVPLEHLDAFETYISRLEERRLISAHELTFTGDLIPIFPNFSYYNLKTYEWLFKWDEWLCEARSSSVDIVPETSPSNDPVHYDRIDLQIMKFLELNGRFSFTEMARKIGVSPQTIKDRYDTKLVHNGIAKHFEIPLQPYPMESLVSHNITLHFTNENEMGRFHSLAKHQLFFVQEFAKVLCENTLSLITRTPHQEAPRMLRFFSRLCEDGHVKDYSTARIDLAHRESSMIHLETFDDSTGKWIFDLSKSLAQLGTADPP